jgi:hypothetical protein
MKRLAISSVALLAALQAFSAVGAENITSAQLNPDNAMKNAASDFSRGICRLYAVAGYTWELPGTAMAVREAEKTYEIIYITDTSDMISLETEAANKRAREYASQYNDVALKNCGSR